MSTGIIILLVLVALAGFTASILGTVGWHLLSILHMSAVRARRSGLVMPSGRGERAASL